MIRIILKFLFESALFWIGFRVIEGSEQSRSGWVGSAPVKLDRIQSCRGVRTVPVRLGRVSLDEVR